MGPCGTAYALVSDFKDKPRNTPSPEGKCSHSCAPRKAKGTPSLLRDSVPGARQEAPQSSALRLCRPACGRPPLRSGWGTPPLALAAPAGVGQGQGVFVSKHSTAIQKRRNTP